MRTPERITLKDGSVRHKVRFRNAGTESSKTFYKEGDARVFASLLGTNRPEQVRDALDWLARLEAGVATTGPTFGEWVERYIDQLTGITSGTREEYRALHRRYLSHLDRVQLAEVNRGHVTDLVNDMDCNGRAPKTIKNVVRGLLAPALALAVDEDKLDKNPTKRVRLPEMSANPDDEDDARFLTYEEYAALEGAFVDRRAYYKPLLQFLIGTGLRWGEVTALQVRHVNLDAGTVRVQQAWKKRDTGGWEIGPPKSRKSRRTVNAAALALTAAAPLLEGKKPTDLVFTGPRGGVLRNAFRDRIWVAACDAAGLYPRPRIHDLRHTHASWLISNGVPLEAVQDQLGHESYDTTRRIYGHLLPSVGVEVGRVASAAMERALNGNRPKELT